MGGEERGWVVFNEPFWMFFKWEREEMFGEVFYSS